MTQEEYLLLNELISTQFGIYFSDHKREVLEARLRPRLQALHLPRYLDYYLQLRCDADGERQRLAELVTNNETYFFREAHQFEALFGPALDELRMHAVLPGTLRVLSAGCSSGEEPYTLSILAQRNAVRMAGTTLSVDAFDIDSQRLEMARRAEYGKGSLRSVEPELVDLLFTRAGERYLLRPGFRAGVRFTPGNILEVNSYLPAVPFDVVFCRNVLIYFSEVALHRALAHFARVLRCGGILFLGHAESIIGLTDRFETVVLGQTIAYRRTEK
jgi:chemotaxis protein methyltransferase CheR